MKYDGIMDKWIVSIIILIVLAAFGGFYLVLNNQEQVPTNISTTTESIVNVPTQTSVTVNISDFAFNPVTLRIKTGTRVIWMNEGVVSHNVVSDTEDFPASSILSKGQSFSHTFSSAGTIKYHCSIHPTMKATIIVSN